MVYCQMVRAETGLPGRLPTCFEPLSFFVFSHFLFSHFFSLCSLRPFQLMASVLTPGAVRSVIIAELPVMLKMCTSGTKVTTTDSGKTRVKDTTLMARIVSVTSYKIYDSTGVHKIPCYELMYQANGQSYTAIVEVETREEVDSIGYRVGRHWYSTGTF